MNEVIIVHLLGVDDVTELFLTQVLGVDAIGSEELPVGHAECLTNGLCNELGLREGGAGLSSDTITQQSRGVRED